MNLDYSDDQKFLKDEARKFLAAACPIGVARQVLDDPESPASAELWAKIADMGWLALAVPEAFGGLGLGQVELCAIAEELGRALAPLPFSTTAYLFSPTLLALGDPGQQEALLPALCRGEVIGCLATAERPGPTNAAALTTTLSGGRLSGVKAPVTDGAVATHAIVLAKGPEGPTLALADLSHAGVTREPLAALDPTRGLARLRFEDVPATPLGQPGGGEAALDAMLDRAAVPFAFEQIGGADRCLEMARDYALERPAFGRVIGGYQAIKHKLADIYVANQLARSNAYFGAWALADGDDALPRAAAAARVAASEAYWLASKEMIETFGGIGVTWEADCHLFYRRAKQLALVIGSLSQWRERLALALERDF